MSMVTVNVEIVYTDIYNGGEENKELEYAKQGDSGFDLRAATVDEGGGGYQIAPGGTIVIPTGIRVAVPEGYEMQVRTRSGSPLKRGFNVGNSPGTIDSGYRGIVGVICHNMSENPIIIDEGERIAQGVICPVTKANFIKREVLDETERGDGAFHSTGVK